MDILIKAAAAAVIASLLGLVVKKSNPESAMLLAIAGGAMVLFLAITAGSKVTDFIKSAGEVSGLSPGVIAIVLKTVGIAIISKISADMCKDAGQAALASSLEFLGSVTAMYIALPLFESVLEIMGSLM